VVATVREVPQVSQLRATAYEYMHSGCDLLCRPTLQVESAAAVHEHMVCGPLLLITWTGATPAKHWHWFALPVKGGVPLSFTGGAGRLCRRSLLRPSVCCP
jgi:hypothetical protein